MIVAAWDKWRVGQAERWCEICGLSFWKLRAPPEMIRSVNWTSGDPSITAALKGLYALKFPGEIVTRARLVALGTEINERYGYVSCSPPD